MAETGSGGARGVGEEPGTVLVVIDIQRGGAMGDAVSGIPLMDGYTRLVEAAERVVAAARTAGLPVIFFQEQHRKSGVDIGRELDGAETMHCVEGEEATELWPTLSPRPDEYHVQKRRYSCFFGTELEILLRGLKASTLVLTGTLTDVCVHYTFADAHQRDYRVRVVTDAVLGSSAPAHEAALDAMAYLQRDALMTTAEFEAALSRRGTGVAGQGER